MLRLDIEYVEHQSFLRDLKLLALTFPAVLTRRGAG
jgi:lipopolysaccharide/colanic/teichoic acid biosynthesis glycosyltransferase